MHDELARAAERHAAHRGTRSGRGCSAAQRGLLELGDDRLDDAPTAPPAIAGAIAARLAPSENGSLVCQMTSPAHSPSARSMARRRPSSTSSPIVFALLLNDTIADVVAQVPHAHRVASRRSSCRSAIARRGRDRESAGGDRPAAWSAAGTASRCGDYGALRRVHAAPPRDRSLTHVGSGTFASALPAAMSSASQPAISFQPAACQISNGPICQPKPQRMREVDVARVVGDRRQVIRAVVEEIAKDRPQELRLRMRAARAACANFSRGSLSARISATAGSTTPSAAAVVAAPRDRAPRCPCRPCGRTRPSSSGRARPCAMSAASTGGVR